MAIFKSSKRKEKQKMTNKRNTTDIEIAAFLARGGEIKQCRPATVVSAADRGFRKRGYSKDAARICRLNMLAA
jgi:hypothetical protein